MSISKIYIYLFILSSFLLTYSSCETKSSPPKKEVFIPKITPEEKKLVQEYDYVIQEQFKLKNAPTGLAVAIVKDGKVLLQRGYGFKNNRTKEEVDENTVFRIASLSKGFASVCAAILVAEKKMKWNTKIKDFIWDFQLSDSLATEKLNVKHVLSQSTGLPRHTFGNLIEAGQSLEKMIPRLREVPLIAQPGEIMAYQNLAYSLIEPMMETVAGRTYENLLREKIFKPLGMKNASADYQSLVDNPNVAKPHSARNGYPIKQEKDYFEVLPAAGVNASIADMAIWTNAMLGHQEEVLNPKILKVIFKEYNRLPKNNPWSRNWEDVKSVGYAMGWRTIEMENRNLVYHGGYLNGYRTEMAFCLEEDVGIVVLSNSFSRFLMQSVPSFFKIYDGIFQKELEKSAISNTSE